MNVTDGYDASRKPAHGGHARGVGAAEVFRRLMSKIGIDEIRFGEHV